MERKEQILTFHNPQAPKMKGNRNYLRPTLPINEEPNASMPHEKQRYHMDRTSTYIRMFCGSLCGLSLLMVLCTCPLSWVEFLVTKTGLQLYAGLWTICKHEMCWSHTPKPPYYLQSSRVFCLISVFAILFALGWLFSSCFHGRESMITNLDMKESLLSFLTAFCLFLCLYLFLAQVHWHRTDVMESNFLWPYYLNWWSTILYVCAGIISFLNYVISQYLPSEENFTVIPTEKSRLGFGPVTTVSLAEDKAQASEVELPDEEPPRCHDVTIYLNPSARSKPVGSSHALHLSHGRRVPRTTAASPVSSSTGNRNFSSASGGFRERRRGGREAPAPPERRAALPLGGRARAGSLTARGRNQLRGGPGAPLPAPRRPRPLHVKGLRTSTCSQSHHGPECEGKRFPRAAFAAAVLRGTPPAEPWGLPTLHAGAAGRGAMTHRGVT
ncbi:PREDICTED: transmembrane protein 202 [Dipodomys ordii]|uniref:Transmembrane protein 202 n=1 Tax=Dipodomys ordii TaxID=10020 RepID=A0A1S3ESJ9_DIPOR|nr:PREDICTED: transmembrane protein 202 [Dipodomys ordii]